jgi:hypothetical protein
MSRLGLWLVMAAFLGGGALLLTAAPAAGKGAAVRWGSSNPAQSTPLLAYRGYNPSPPGLPSEFSGRTPAGASQGHDASLPGLPSEFSWRHPVGASRGAADYPSPATAPPAAGPARERGIE